MARAGEDHVSMLRTTCESLPSASGHQRWMMNEVNKLVWPAEGGIGSIPQETWDQTVQISLDATIITKEPDAAASRSDLADAARAMLTGDVTGESFVPGEVPITPNGD